MAAEAITTRVQRIRPRQAKHAKSTVPKVLSPGEAQRILGNMGNAKSLQIVRRRVIHETLYKAGLRSDELTNLAVGDVHLAEEFPYIRVVYGKGGKQRHVPVSPVLQECLGLWVGKWRPDRGDLMFPRIQGPTAGERMTNRELRSIVKTAGEKVGLGWVHPHTWRHTCATDLLGGGCNIMEVKEFLGHASVQTTMIYLHIRQEELHASVAKAQEQAKRFRDADIGEGDILKQLRGILAQLEGNNQEEDERYA